MDFILKVKRNRLAGIGVKVSCILPAELIAGGAAAAPVGPGEGGFHGATPSAAGEGAVLGGASGTVAYRPANLVEAQMLRAIQVQFHLFMH